jgi:hypothetical protein
MHRRTLILRRFGDLSFGLGYDEDGVWVDHSVATDMVDDAHRSDAERAALAAVHAWFDCCRDARPIVPVIDERFVGGVIEPLAEPATSRA